MSKRSGNPAKAGWDPMRRTTVDPGAAALNVRLGEPISEVWINRLYECVVRDLEGGARRLSIKRLDRAAVRDWRHFQAIKNEVAGPDLWAVELYPPEDHLIDGANEYHLWVLPPGERPPFGLPAGEHGPQVHGPETIDRLNEVMREHGRAGKGVQRPWEPGLPTGQGWHDYREGETLTIRDLGDLDSRRYRIVNVDPDGTLTLERKT